MQKTTSRLVLIDHLVTLFKSTPVNTIKKIIYLLQGKLSPAYEGIELGLGEKLTIRAIAESSGISVKEVEEKYGIIGDLGETAKEISKNKYQQTLLSEKITIERIYSTFEKIAKSLGSQSQIIKLRLVSSLLNDATPLESKYIIKFLLGNLRLGIAEYSIIDALAIAFTGNRNNRKKEETYNIYTDLGTIGEILFKKELEGLNELQITPLKPIRPMLAERITDPIEGLKKANGMIAFEYKLDGERVQIHKNDTEVQLFSRSLEKITNHYPDIVDAIKKFSIHNCILEAEIVPLDLVTKKIQPFQELMHRKRKYNINDVIQKYPIKVFLFDILYLEGNNLTQYEYTKRRAILKSTVEKDKNNTIELVKQIVSSKLNQIEIFFRRAKDDGCEGLMLKQLNSKYRAGAREFLWMKLKKEYDNTFGDTFDLTVIGALLGKGKRTGYYGALLLASYDKNSDTFQSICKVGTGFSDHDLELIYNELKNYVVALRFPKYSGRIRFDKKPEDSTNTSELIQLFNKQVKRNKL